MSVPLISLKMGGTDILVCVLPATDNNVCATVTGSKVGYLCSTRFMNVDDTIIVPIVFIVVYLLVLSMGILVRSGKTWLIAGYDASQVRDEKGLTRWVGWGVMGIGISGLIGAALMFAFPDVMVIFVLAANVMTLGGVATLVLTSRRFFK
jgi:hypothetical protein